MKVTRNMFNGLCDQVQSGLADDPFVCSIFSAILEGAGDSNRTTTIHPNGAEVTMAIFFVPADASFQLFYSSSEGLMLLDADDIDGAGNPKTVQIPLESQLATIAFEAFGNATWNCDDDITFSSDLM